MYSEELPELIDRIEEQARRSKRFRFALLSCGDELGGRGGPEMERIFKLMQDAEAELATVVEFEDERELRSLHSLGRTLRAMVGRKILIYKRKPRTDRDRRYSVTCRESDFRRGGVRHRQTAATLREPSAPHSA